MTFAAVAPTRTTTTAGTGIVRVTRRAKHLPPAISRRTSTNHLEPTTVRASPAAGHGVVRSNRVATVPHQNSINHRRAGNGTTGGRRRYGAGGGGGGGGLAVYYGGHVDNPISVKPNPTSPRSDEQQQEEEEEEQRRRKKTKHQQQHHQRQLQPPANHKWHGDDLTVDSADGEAAAVEQQRR
uniref:Uncharacterized protein n=1 Tax=Anopheles triannulatus TaxID=58253 RepID=A0A2M4AVW0_9DIPT